MLDGEDGLRGYLFGRHGHVREHLGPLVARGHDAARVLVQSCLAAIPGRPVFMDVPDDQQAFTAFLAAEGFRAERPFLRMYRGALTAPGEPRAIFAIAGPEFG